MYYFNWLIDEPGVRWCIVDCVFLCRSRFVIISGSTVQLRLVLFERTWERVVILFGDSAEVTGVVAVKSVHDGREFNFATRVFRLVGARIDLFSFEKNYYFEIVSFGFEIKEKNSTYFSSSNCFSVVCQWCWGKFMTLYKCCRRWWCRCVFETVLLSKCFYWRWKCSCSK